MTSITLTVAQMNQTVSIISLKTIILALAVSTLCPILYSVYNTLFHPLRNFPGPRLWAASRIPWCWYQYKGTLHVHILRLHEQYGTTVRISPNELSYCSDTAWKAIYGHRTVEMSKDPVFSLHTPTGAQNILVADRETHIRQRRLLSHAFSEKALREQESIIQLYVRKLLSQLEGCSSRDPVDLVAWMNFTTFDLIGDMSFGENFGCLDSGTYAPFVKAIKAMATELTFAQMWKYWKLSSVRGFFMSKQVKGQRVKHVRTAMGSVDRRMQLKTDRKDFLSYILAANDEKGMSVPEIYVNAFSLNIAGSESTATALSGALFFILSHPPVLQRLVREIRSSFSSLEEITLARVSGGIEYLDAVLTESMRLYPPVAGTLPRVVPEGGQVIDNMFVRAGTTVGLHHFSCSRLSKNFTRPDDFAPERWMQGTSGFEQDKAECMQVFSFGPRNCLGKNLAKAEMRLILTKVLFRFNIELLPDQERWQKDQLVHGFWEKPPLLCRVSVVR